MSTDAGILSELEKKSSILEQIASGTTLRSTLDNLLHAIEELRPGVLGSILLLHPETKTLHLGGAPSLPAPYNRAVDGVPIGPGIGSCGTAAYEGKLVVVEDIATHPYWAKFKHLALQYNLRSCWSHPIFSRRGTVLGTFAMYHHEPSGPSEDDLRLISSAAHIAAVAIEHDQIEYLRCRSMETLKRSNESLEQFAYVASHDLQEPIRTISVYIEMLDRQAGPVLDETAKLYVSFIQGASKRMKSMIEAWLSYSRAASCTFQLEVVDVTALVEEIRTALSAAFAQAGAELRAEHLPFVFTDRQALGLIFQNLIANAVKFRGSLPPKIVVTASQSADQTFFCVRDNGIGIETESQEKIFQLFGRSRQHSEFQGTGIGLAMCKRLVEGLGGQIWVVSKPGEGAAFHFSLPNRKSIIDFQKSFPT